MSRNWSAEMARTMMPLNGRSSLARNGSMARISQKMPSVNPSSGYMMERMSAMRVEGRRKSEGRTDANDFSSALALGAGEADGASDLPVTRRLPADELGDPFTFAAGRWESDLPLTIPERTGVCHRSQY